MDEILLDKGEWEGEGERKSPLVDFSSSAKVHSEPKQTQTPIWEFHGFEPRRPSPANHVIVVKDSLPQQALKADRDQVQTKSLIRFSRARGDLIYPTWWSLNRPLGTAQHGPSQGKLNQAHLK